MRNMTVLFLTLICAVPFIATALEMGPGVATLDGQQLKWTDGAHGYHIMFQSLLANLDAANDNSGGLYNPQADACLGDSTYALNDAQIPADAVVERAFLIWTAAQPGAKLADLTDNTVRLEFIHATVAELNAGLDVVGREARLTDEQDFEFEAFLQKSTEGERGFFTHRVDVTDFFTQIQEKGRNSELQDGASLYGDYIVSGLDCSSDPAYLDVSMMVANWSIVIVYSSATVTPRDIYLYHGMGTHQHVSVPWSLTGFTLPADPKILLTLNTIEGDGGLVNPAGSTIPESLKLNGAGGDPVDLQNSCNYPAQGNNMGQPFLYTEIFNSISSVYGLDPTLGETCIGGTPPNITAETIEYAIDMDTFYIDGATEAWAGQFPAGSNSLTVTLGANQDAFFTNFLILAIDHATDDPITDDDDDTLLSDDTVTDDTNTGTDDDTSATDELATDTATGADTTTTPDNDIPTAPTKKVADDGCGCSLLF